ncbi:bifunctional diaminohydroxyphosphoribosylaminopyrimidine deaminase/5-amino-6-(5-phosphoribosylamino)uracil reductase RibD [Oceanospirillum maris]|uniref:bifunctional diaminohydroxyphosphoribosylaminopyrimidine deaminase/5-amino-6-(5-phosphoribosylamino)uracil reductase RibD n=1 Tax=Oceanospirillum maris TaxID=64977 RepID=UPI000404B0C6|nr:bifunctional diaminohydroxyphosphoribosylaminopyrimidine deaminase/5-amino-6-(5-phosphoribosylamino)uracil reductase RibD [Oceanospirillum maris]
MKYTDASSQTDAYFMARAIRLARLGHYTTFPNPRVGCVLVKEGKIIAEGWHQKAGEGHAEVNALAQTDDTNGATAYVTLEPCSHTGRTPPCSDALIKAGIVRVVIGMNDPNPLVAGNGIRKLKAAGIEVCSGICETDARALNPGFIHRMTLQRPFIRAKLACSIDGRTAMASGESQWITGPAARTQVQRLRAGSSAIISGIDSVICDDSALTVRAEQLKLENGDQIAQRQPLRVILDTHLRLPINAKILKQSGETVILYVDEKEQKQLDIEEKRQALEKAGAQCVAMPVDKGHVSLAAVMAYLHGRECNEVLLETGATLAGAFAVEGLIDELVIFMAPTLLGNGARGLLNLPEITQMADQQRLEITDCRMVGSDMMITARFIGKL